MQPQVPPEAPEKSLERQIRAFHWVRLLAELPARCAGGEGEREAAQRVETWLRGLGFSEIAPAAVASRPRPGAVVALHAGLAAIGCLFGGLFGFALAALSLGSYRRERGRGAALLSRCLPAPDSLVLCARAGAGRPRRRVVISASLDAPQAGRLFASPWLRRRLGPSGAAQVDAPAGLDAWCLRALLAAALVTAASALGADAALVHVAQGALALLLGLAAAAGVEWALAPAGPGACASASGVAAMLTCGEQLLAQLRDDEELWLVAAGAGEVGGCGLRAFLDQHAEAFARDTLFIHFERVGGGALHRVRAEVGLRRSVHPPQLAELARRVAASGAFGAVGALDWIGATGAAAAVERDLPVLALVSLEADGLPRADSPRPDGAESVDAACLVRAADFGAAVVEASLRGEADALAIV